MTTDLDNPITVPDGFTLHTENTSHILLSSNEAFLNPVQEFNRDISVACIRVWSEEMAKAKEKLWLEKRDRKRRKGLFRVLSCRQIFVMPSFSAAIHSRE
jgi:tRNA G26 N,N-dimethylase Trm1